MILAKNIWEATERNSISAIRARELAIGRKTLLTSEKNGQDGSEKIMTARIFLAIRIILRPEFLASGKKRTRVMKAEWVIVRPTKIFAPNLLTRPPLPAKTPKASRISISRT